jgi:hypothetical protein
MLISSVFRATVSKDISINGSNEDHYCLRLRGPSPRAAVFDGATESFAARKWARILSGEWGKDSSRDWNWVATAQMQYGKYVKGLNLSWAQEAASQRGSFSTFAFFEVHDDWIQFSTVGDSHLFFLSHSKIQNSFPFEDESEFNSVPGALSSNSLDLRRNIENILNGMSQIKFNSKKFSHIVLATDAVAAWLLSSNFDLRDQRAEKLLNCQDGDNFRKLIIEERSAGLMKIDDSTVVVLGVS